MLFAIGLILIAIAGGAALTYLYDREATLPARLCMGACTGLAALGLVGFVIASFIGMTPLMLLISAAIVASPLLLLSKPVFRTTVQADVRAATQGLRRAVLHPSGSAYAYFIFYALLIVLLYFFFDRAVVEKPDGIYTGGSNNLGDLPFHFASITSFVYGQNFPPEDPSYSGTRFAYPFIADFVAAMLMRAGASLRNCMFLHNMVLAISLVGVLHRWTLKLTRNYLAGFLAPLLLLFSGGLGWLILLRDARVGERGIFSVLMDMQHDYTILPGNAWRWGNSLTTLFITQRSLLFGLPIAITIFTLLWSALNEKGEIGEKGKGEKGKSRSTEVNSKASRPLLYFFPSYPFSYAATQMIAAGVMTGLLLLVHAHTFLTVMGVAACLAVLRDDWRAWGVLLGAGTIAAIVAYRWGQFTALIGYSPGVGGWPRLLLAGSIAALFTITAIPLAKFAREAFKKGDWPWREWVVFFTAALLLAVPQMLWIMSGSSVEAKSFIGTHFGWDKAEDANFVIFWLKNCGLFIPLLLVALLWRGKDYLIERRWLMFYLPFTLCFIGPNLVKLAPWPWDNIKVLIYWYVASIPIVALVLARLWQQRSVALKVLMGAMLLSLVLAGALDVWRVTSKQINYQE
jgi:hypothetical protein